MVKHPFLQQARSFLVMNKMISYYLSLGCLCSCLVGLNFSSYAQQDSTQNPQNIQEDRKTQRIAKKAARRIRFLATLPANHNPKTASLLGLIPGGGQIYNRRFWKLPIVYGGFGALGYFTVSSYIEYGCFRRAYLETVDDDPNTNYVCPQDPNASEASLKIYRDNARSSSEIFVLGFVLFWGLTIVDAFVDAHLMHFDISDDLSMRLQPKLDYDISMQSIVPALGLSFQLRTKPSASLPIKFD